MTIKKIILLVLVAMYWVSRGSARKTPKKIHKVLVVQMAKLGDMVCTTPMFRAIKDTYPEAMVYVLGNTINEQVVAHNSDVTEYIVFANIKETFNRLTREQFDCAFLAGGPDMVSTSIAFLANIPLVVAPRITGGVSPLYDVWYQLMVSLVVTKPHEMGTYAPREYLRLLEPIGIQTDDTTKHLSYSDVARKKIKVFLQEHDLKEKKFAIISPSAGNKIKRWPSERFARVAEYIVSQGISIVVIGGSRDREEVEDMMRAVERPQGIVNALERFSIDELKACIAQARFFVAVDTGPVYIAEAFGTPTVDIVGPMDEREQPPRSEIHLVVAPPPPRTPQLHAMNARVYDEKEVRRQTESISVDMVVNACRKLLNIVS